MFFLIKKSPIYKMLFGEAESGELQDEKKPVAPVIVHNIKSDDNERDSEDEDIFNIYLNDDESDVKKDNIRKEPRISDDIKRAVISLLIVVIVLLMGNKIIIRRKIPQKREKAEKKRFLIQRMYILMSSFWKA
mgnify:CR=1 FL=1